MGMNIYQLKKDGGQHIGKRFANGIWCWDCHIKAERDVLGAFWYCPQCGVRCSEKTLSFKPAFRELGFDKTKERIRSGVDGASGFVWHGKDKKDAESRLNVAKLKTEYGQTWTIERFRSMFKDVIEETYSDNDFS